VFFVIVSIPGMMMKILPLAFVPLFILFEHIHLVFCFEHDCDYGIFFQGSLGGHVQAYGIMRWAI